MTPEEVANTVACAHRSVDMPPMGLRLFACTDCIARALRDAYERGVEDAAQVADSYADAAASPTFQVSKQRNSMCIAKAIRRLTKEDKR